MFQRYEKVHRLEKPECEGILEGTCYIFEKIDGANASVWLDNGVLCAASHNQIMSGDKVLNEFRGLAQYVQDSEPIKRVLAMRPNWRLYGEWLVKHTINYPAEHMDKLYVFDVFDESIGRFLAYEEYFAVLDSCGVLFIKPWAIITNPTMEDLKGYVGKSAYGVDGSGEGIVVKNYAFQHKGCQNYAKLVSKDFKEVNHLLFTAQRSDAVEVRIANQYITKARVNKICHKMVDDDPTIVLEMKHIPQVMGRVFNDIVTEDMWDILRKFKNPTIDFGKLKKASDTKTKNYYVEILGERSYTVQVPENFVGFNQPCPTEN